MAGAADLNQGVKLSTQTKRSLHWDLWMQFLRYIELNHDPYLDTLEPWCCPRIGVAFAKAYQAGHFGTKGVHASSQQIAGGTIDSVLGNVAEAFRAHERLDPFVNSNGHGTRFYNSK